MTRELAWWLVRSFLQLSNCHMSQHYPNKEMSKQLHMSSIENSKRTVFLFYPILLFTAFACNGLTFATPLLVMVAGSFHPNKTANHPVVCEVELGLTVPIGFHFRGLFMNFRETSGECHFRIFFVFFCRFYTKAFSR